MKDDDPKRHRQRVGGSRTEQHLVSPPPPSKSNLFCWSRRRSSSTALLLLMLWVVLVVTPAARAFPPSSSTSSRMISTIHSLRNPTQSLRFQSSVLHSHSSATAEATSTSRTNSTMGVTDPDSATSSSSPTSAGAFVQRSLERQSPNDVLPPPELSTAGPLPKDGDDDWNSDHDFSNIFPLDLVVMGGDPNKKDGSDCSLVEQAVMITAVLSGTNTSSSSKNNTSNNNAAAASLVLQGGTGTAKSVVARSLQRLLGVEAVYVPPTISQDGLTGTVDVEASLAAGQAVFSPGLLWRAHHERRILVADDVNLMDSGDSEAASTLCNALSDGRVRVEREGLSVAYDFCPAAVVATWNPQYEELREHVLDRFAMHVCMDDDDAAAAMAGGAGRMSVRDRVQVVLNVEAFVDRNLPPGQGGPEQSQHQFRLQQALEAERRRIEQIQRAQQLLDSVDPLSRPQLLALAQQATAWDCPGQRAEIFAATVARAAAALDGRTAVQPADLQVAVRLCIVPRGRAVPVLVAEGEPGQEDAVPDRSSRPQPPDLQPLQPPPDMAAREEEEEKEDQEDETQSQMEEEEEEPHDADKDQDEQDEEEPLVLPEEFLFGVDFSVKVDPRLLQFHHLKPGRRGRRAGKRHRRFNLERGRFVRAIFPRGDRGRLAVGATLRAAAPHQLARRRLQQRAEQEQHEQQQQQQLDPSASSSSAFIRRHKVKQRRPVKVYIDKDDFRIQQLKKKTGSLIIFVVDASGSMALNRMSAAKGSAMMLLQEAYKSRDKIALIAFSGQAAEVVVPPTKSVALTRRRLEGMPCGSQTPLADALVQALRMGLNAIKVKQDTGRVVLVLISDCRPNVPLCVSQGEEFDATTMGDDGGGTNGSSLAPANGQSTPSRKFLRDEVVAIARQIGAMDDDFDLLCIDTEDKFVRTGVAEELARVSGGNYYSLDKADHQSITKLVSKATQQ